MRELTVDSSYQQSNRVPRSCQHLLSVDDTNPHVAANPHTAKTNPRTANRTGLTVRELEESTGFDRRTIAYYVQEGLLPRVGRRGRRTRYPTYIRDRLLFIRRVREAEDAGDIPPVSLAELAEAFARLPRGVVAAVADGAASVSKELFADDEAGAQAAASRIRSAAARRRVLEERVRLSRRRRPGGASDSPGLASDPPGVVGASPGVVGAPPDEPPAAMDRGEMDRGAGVVRYLRAPSRHWAGEATADYGDKERVAAVLGITLAAVSDAARRREEESADPVDTWMRAEVVPGVELSVRGATEEDVELLEQAAASLRELVVGKRRPVAGASLGDE